MSRLVSIGKNMVELSGLRNIWVGSDHLCRSRMTLFYPNNPNKPTVEITYEYGKWAECHSDAKILEDAKKAFEIDRIRQSNNNIVL
jgi:hypothetical protein